MRDLLTARGIQLSKSLGQNFLHDANQLQRIASLGELTASDKILEIGPGLGPLTELLLDSGGKVFAIEKDRRLVDFLRERFADRTNFDLLQDDALAYLKDKDRDWSGWKLVANLPYSVASPILVELALGTRPPERLVATLQWEVVQRIAAKADEEHYGLLSLYLQLRYEPKEWFKIPAACFFPAPDVDSATILLKSRAEPLLSSEQVHTFKRLAKLAFSERRKMMAKLLKQQWPAERVLASFEQLGISAQARAQTVSLEQFVALTKLLG
ncbi:MAG TPA: 16S rRNA (adenine(1518)-N(6)/adenine(1519)-N(6))-dimethyltransferase RsmA [Verrucomicrobiae bacterium]